VPLREAFRWPENSEVGRSRPNGATSSEPPVALSNPALLYRQAKRPHDRAAGSQAIPAAEDGRAGADLSIALMHDLRSA